VFKPWCKQRAAQLFRFAHRRFAGGEGRGGIVFQFARTSDAAGGLWPTDESGWRYLPQRSICSLGIKTNHVLSAVQRYSPQQQCVVIVLVKEAKFDRFYFLNAPKSVQGSGSARGGLGEIPRSVGAAGEVCDWYSQFSGSAPAVARAAMGGEVSMSQWMGLGCENMPAAAAAEAAAALARAGWTTA